MIRRRRRKRRYLAVLDANRIKSEPSGVSECMRWPSVALGEEAVVAGGGRSQRLRQPRRRRRDKGPVRIRRVGPCRIPSYRQKYHRLAKPHHPPPMATAAMALSTTIHLHHPPRFLLLSSNPLCTSSYPWLSAWSSPRSRGRLPRPPVSALDLRPEPSPSSDSDDEDAVGTSRSSGRSTMSLILGRLRRAGYSPEELSSAPAALAEPARHPLRGSVEDVFRADDGVLPNARGGFDDDGESSLVDARFPWERPMPPPEAAARAARSKSWMAELTLPAAELRRLRHAAMRLKSRIKVGGAGVTQEIAERIRDKWRAEEEVVRIKVSGSPALNMRLFHEILERKTGGLVIWRSGTSVCLYRGVAYDTLEPTKGTSKNFRALGMKSSIKGSPSPLLPNEKVRDMQDSSGALASNTEKDELVEQAPEIKYEDEIDKLLEELGPRYNDWPGSDPSPVDADLLPATVPGYRPPFRVLPYGVRPSLSRKDTTNLRRLARGLPPHFALGRSRQLQGLAAAMVKLWEKSSIAKITLKRGVQLTTSERMAEDIKKLTGGVMLSRNNDFIVFYRGKDFLCSELAGALLEREGLAKSLQDEEQARLNAASSFSSHTEGLVEPTVAGTLGETLEANSKYGNELDDNYEDKMTRTVEAARHADLVRKLEWKLSLAEKKIAKAERVLGKVETALKPTEGIRQPEMITDEERFMFRKLGLRMKAFLLLGRRGVFDGTIENMHLHWKYRELVKILVKAKSFGDVKKTALFLEAESGGILVSVDRVSKGYAIVVFRGKDYRRPSKLRPRNLLSKRKALARSIEIQRKEALNRHIANLNRKVKQLEAELLQMEGVKEEGDEELYAKLDSAYSSEEEDVDDEDDEAYLRGFDNVAAIHNAGDRASIDGGNSTNYDVEGDYSDDNQEEDDFDYENDDDDEDGVPSSSTTSDGNLYNHADSDLDCQNSYSEQSNSCS